MGKRLVIAVVIAAVVLIPAVVFGQMGNFNLRYDTKTVTTITGNVVTTVTYNPGDPTTSAQSVIVASGMNNYNVFLGPGWFVNQSGLSFAQGTPVIVKGSMRSINGRSYLVASTITEGNKMVTFRNAAGVPAWSNTAVPAPTGAGPGVLVPFDTNNMGNISGTITNTYQVQTADRGMPSVVAVVKSGITNKSYNVLLAPEPVLSLAGISAMPGKYLAVDGSFVQYNNKPYVVATRVAQGTNMAILRTNAGVPVTIESAPPPESMTVPPPPMGNYMP